MKQDTNFEIRDLRDRFFRVDDAYINGHARHCGIYATGVYVTLCRHANTAQSCFPSIGLISEKLNISKRQVIRSLATLEEFNIIFKRKNEGKKTIYYLLDKKKWKPVPLSHQCHSVTGDHQTPTGDCQSPLVVTDSHPNQTNITKNKRTLSSVEREKIFEMAEKALQQSIPRYLQLHKVDYFCQLFGERKLNLPQIKSPIAFISKLPLGPDYIPFSERTARREKKETNKWQKNLFP